MTITEERGERTDTTITKSNRRQKPERGERKYNNAIEERGKMMTTREVTGKMTMTTREETGNMTMTTREERVKTAMTTRQRREEIQQQDRGERKTMTTMTERGQRKDNDEKDRKEDNRDKIMEDDTQRPMGVMAKTRDGEHKQK